MVIKPINILPTRTQMNVISATVGDAEVQYIDTGDGDTYIRYDGAASQVIVLSQLQAEADEAQAQLDAIPPDVSDEELLAWARANYPMMDYSARRTMLQAIVDNNTLMIQQVGG